MTNGSIYIEMAHLTDGQQLLLALPDEILPEGVGPDADGARQGAGRHVRREQPRHRHDRRTPS